MYDLTLGSLFDGSGGFPLGGLYYNIRPLWASEIEPYPIAVTSARLPHMQHLGDVTKISGAEIPTVDIITFGSPCTNMSQAGKREGLNGKQSALFYEAIRIIKEMREHTNGRYPQYAVWESVPGAFSSNAGEDFRAVLQAFVQICEPTAEVPAPAKNRWPFADILLGDGWSVAYRTIDAQYFGVAQRRKRIYLVADFRTECAGDILFEPEGVCRDYSQGSGEGQAIAAEAAGSATETSGVIGVEPVICLNDQGGQFMNVSYDITGTLCVGLSNHSPIVMDSKTDAYCIAGNIIDRKPGNGGNGFGYQQDICYTLNTTDRHAICEEDYCYQEKVGALCATDSRGIGNQSAKQGKCIVTRQKRVRRLMPGECARLQGFHPHWGMLPSKDALTEQELKFWFDVRNTYALANGRGVRAYAPKQILAWYHRLHSNSAEYKLWGNGVALPCVRFVLGGIAEQHARQTNATDNQ